MNHIDTKHRLDGYGVGYSKLHSTDTNEMVHTQTLFEELGVDIDIPDSHYTPIQYVAIILMLTDHFGLTSP